MKSKLSPQEEKIMEAFDKEFTVIVEYHKWSDEDELYRLSTPIKRFKDFPNTNPDYIRDWILTKLREERGQIIEEIKKWLEYEEGKIVQDEWKPVSNKMIKTFVDSLKSEDN